MTNSFFIPSETKPGKSKIASLLKSLGFIERTSTPLWSYTYTRLRVDQVDFRDDHYEDAEWIYDTDFDNNWAVRITLHETHKPHHQALFQALTLIASQVYETDDIYLNAKGQEVPGNSIQPQMALDWESVLQSFDEQVVGEDLEEEEKVGPVQDVPHVTEVLTRPRLRELDRLEHHKVGGESEGHHHIYLHHGGRFGVVHHGLHVEGG